MRGLGIRGLGLHKAVAPAAGVGVPSLDFARGIYTYPGGLSGNIGCIRASQGYARNIAGALTLFGNNVPRITDEGLLIEPGRTNSIRNPLESGTGGTGGLPDNWVESNSNKGTVARSIVGSGTEDGIAYKDYRFVGTTAGSGFWVFSPEPSGTNGIHASGSSKWAASVYARISAGSIANLDAAPGQALEEYNFGSFVGNSFASAGMASTGTLGSNRLISAGTLNASTNRISPHAGFSWTGAVAIDITIRVGYWQLEAASDLTATSPVYTTSSTVGASRSTDNLIALGTLQNILAAQSGSVELDTNLSNAAAVASLLGMPGGVVMLGKTAADKANTALGTALTTSNTAVWTAPVVVTLNWAAAAGSINLGGTITSDANGRAPSKPVYLGSSDGLSNYLNGFVSKIKASASVAVNQAPAFAAAYGISQTLLYDDFDSTGTIDTTNSQVLGFNWYLNNSFTWQGSGSGPATPATTDQYSAANSILQVVTQYGSDGGLQFATYDYKGVGQTINTVPLISGSKPFYVEGSAQFISGQYATLWMQDLSSLLRSIDNAGNGNSYAEFDIFEQQGSNNGRNVHVWTSPSANSTPLGFFSNAGPYADFNTWGVLVVPRAYNGGTGFVQFYKNGIADGSALTWSGADTYGIEASNYAIMFAQSHGPTANLQIAYIAAWVRP